MYRLEINHGNLIKDMKYFKVLINISENLNVF